jgi:glucosamine 6-phosphate synthetase-like amidotransferase/phosphosugar isomerase protein
VHVGCGTSFHAALSGGFAIGALEAVLRRPDADVMVCVSHEGETDLTIEAARAFPGPIWLVTGKQESALAQLAAEVVVATPEVERSWCHTASYTCAVAAIRALHGEDIGGLPDAVEKALRTEVELPKREKVIVLGAGDGWPTAQEAALKLREGAWVDAYAYSTEQILHGYFAAIDGDAHVYVLQGRGRAAERASVACEALHKLDCEVTVVETEHPVVDIVYFQLLTLAIAAAKGVDPDPIRRTPDSKWAKAAGSAYPG